VSKVKELDERYNTSEKQSKRGSFKTPGRQKILKQMTFFPALSKREGNESSEITKLDEADELIFGEEI
jgi:hypothetical protein